MLPGYTLAWLLSAFWTVVAVQQPMVVGLIQFDGNRAFDSDTLKGRLRMTREGGWYQAELVPMDLPNLQRFYQGEGYLRARIGTPEVRAEAAPGRSPRAIIRIPVTEGPLYRLGKIAVLNSAAFDAESLLGMCPVRPGEAFSRAKLSDWVTRVEDGYRQLGYLRFRAELKEDVSDLRRVVDCVLECSEGPAYRVGRIVIVGLPAAEQANFRRRLLIHEGGAYNPEMIPLSLHFIQASGAYKPIMTSDLDIRIDDTKGTVDVTIKVEPARKSSSQGRGDATSGFAFGFAPARQEPAPTIRAEVGLVNVVFAAVDRRDRPVPGLRADDFLVFEDKQPQAVEFFSVLDRSAQVPVTIAFLIDTSGSVKSKLEYEKETAAEFFRAVLRPGKDLALIMQFDSEVNLVQDFTDDAERLVRALDTLRAGNSTSLYDALYLAVEEKLRTETGRRVILALTDGEDTSSRLRKEQAIEAAQRADVQIYGIGVKSDFGESFGILRKFAQETGGLFFSPRARFDEIQEAFRRIGEDLQGQYSLAYTPTNRKRDGSFRNIEIRSKVSSVKVRARKGYYAPKDLR